MSVQVLQRVVRRETHSPRTAVAALVLVLVALTAVYAGVEIVLMLCGRGPLWVSPRQAVSWLTGLPQAQPQAAVIAGSALATLIGVVLLWCALSPGRLPKHQMDVSSHAVVVDNGVIAAAVAERVRHDLDLSRGEVLVGVGHRIADVTIRTEPGHVVDRARVIEVAQAELDGYRTLPATRVRARVRPRAEKGKA